MTYRWTPRHGCADLRRSSLGRRSFLKAGMLGGSGLTLAELLRHEARAATSGANKPGGKRTNTVIILWMRGGPSHIDMWDPKPDAPAEYRGEFGTIDTTVPGIQLGDLLPMCAKAMDKWSIIRSLYHDDAGHSTGDQICFTGYPAGRSPTRTCTRAAARSWPGNWATCGPSCRPT